MEKGLFVVIQFFSFVFIHFAIMKYIYLLIA